MSHPRGWIALAATLLFAPGSGRADAPPAIDLPQACAWSTSDAGGPALACRNGDGATVAVSISGLNPDSVAQARAGDAAAIRNVARFYAFGPLDRRDSARAVALFKAAAAAGDVRAMFTLAELYDLGFGGVIDHAEATRWYQAAAEKGDLPAMISLGNAYAAGRGVPQDMAQALKWYKAAADKGDPRAMTHLGVLSFSGKAVPQSYAQAISWWRSAADANEPEAEDDLAYVYERGLGVPPDKEAAAQLRAQSKALGKWASLPSEADMRDSFPPAAAVAGVNGLATYYCRIGEDRTPEDCILVSEAPASFGFGLAGFQLLPKMRISAGLPAGLVIAVPVRFTNATGILGNRARADECAAEGLALRKTRTLQGDADWYARYWLALAHYYAQQAGEADPPGRLDAAVADAADRIGQGKDSGFMSPMWRCSLR